MALVFLLPSDSASNARLLQPVLDPRVRTGWPSLVLTATFLMFIDVIIDPVALRGDRWFLGLIYGYPAPGLYFGIPLMNFVGWAVVGFIALSIYFMFDWRLPALPSTSPATRHLLLGCALYYGVLIFNLIITFWIGELLLGLVGVMIYLPVTILFALRLLNRMPHALIPGQAASARIIASRAGATLR
jgi:putative membrane protein